MHNRFIEHSNQSVYSNVHWRR